MEVHVTELATYRWCRRCWRYQYVDRLVPATPQLNALWFGIAMHEALAELYGGGNPVAKFLELTRPDRDIDPEKWGEYVTLGERMLEGYVKRWAREDAERWRVLAREFPMRQPLTPEVTLVGKVDLLIRDMLTGKMWIVDHKTFASFADPADLELDDQMTLYMWLVGQMGERPAGAIYNQLRKKIPSEPYELKAGGLSKAKNLDTTREVYLAAIHRLGLDPKDYREVLDSLAGVEFFRRDLVVRPQAEIELFVDECRALVGEMQRGVEYTNRSSSCKWLCPYTQLCRMESLGGDVELLKSLQYRREE